MEVPFNVAINFHCKQSDAQKWRKYVPKESLIVHVDCTQIESSVFKGTLVQIQGRSVGAHVELLRAVARQASYGNDQKKSYFISALLR